MKFDEALKYQDSLDAVEAGTANSTQIAEAEAVVVAVRNYVASIYETVTRLKGGLAMIDLFEDRADAIRKAIDGDAALAEPRIALARDGSIVAAIKIAPLISLPVE